MAWVDLHRHIDGSLRMDTIVELAKEKGIKVPPLADIVFHQGMDLSAALQCFAFTLSFLQEKESLQRIVGEICTDAKDNNVAHLELRFAPQLHQMEPMEAVVDMVLDALSPGVSLILCGFFVIMSICFSSRMSLLSS